MPPILSTIIQCLVALCVLHGAGFVVLRIWGVAALRAHYLAPFATICMLAGFGYAQGYTPLRWNLATLVVSWLALALISLVIRLGVLRVRASVANGKADPARPGHPGSIATDTEGARYSAGEAPRRLGPLVFGAVVASLGLAFLTLSFAVNHVWTMPSQTWDAVLHGNSVRLLIDSENGYPWSLRYSPFVQYPDPPFYPATFYQLAASVVTFSGASVIAATNIAAFLIAGWIFPLGMAFLVSCLQRKAPLWQPLAILLGPSLWSFPWAPLGWGVLWPSAVSIAMIPFALAAVIRTFSSEQTRWPSRMLWCGIALIGAVLTAASHPRGAVQFIIASAIFVVFRSIAITLRPPSRVPRTPLVRRLAAAALALTIVGALYWSYAQLTSDAYKTKVTNFFWPIQASPQEEVWNYLVQGPENTEPAYALGILIALGICVSLVRPRYLWLTAGYLTFAWLDITAATTHEVDLLQITQLWYNDRHRITGATAIFAIPLMCIAISSLARLLKSIITRITQGDNQQLRHRQFFSEKSLIVILVAIVGIATAGFNVQGHIKYLSGYYRDVQNTIPGTLVSAGEQTFMESLSRWVRPGEVVVNMPGDGSPMLYALSGVQPMFPSTNALTGGPELVRVAQNLTLPGKVTELCTLLHKYKAPWLLTSTDPFYTESVRAFDLPSLHVSPGDPNFTVVAEGGGMTLYKISACFPT